MPTTIKITPTSITYRSTTRKPYKPKVGDTKVVKGVHYTRQLQRVYFNGVCIGINRTGGRSHYEWVKTEPQPEIN